MLLRTAGFTALTLLLCTPPLAAQVENPVRWSLALQGPKTVAAGSTVTLALTATVDEGWHLYSTTQPPGGPVATRITVAEGGPFELLTSPVGPAPRIAFDPNFSMETEFYDADVVFDVSVRVSETAPPGPYELVVNARFQACDERFCLPPRTERLVVPLQLVAGRSTAGGKPGAGDPRPAVPGGPPVAVVVAPAAPAADSTSVAPDKSAPPVADPPRVEPPQSPVRFDHEQPSTLRGYVILAMTFGALSLLTPCVFPMVPITVSYFTARAGVSRRRALSQALVYCAGIILSFTALGMVLAIAVGASGLNQFAANPWINLAIAAIFLGFAASLIGRFEIALPSLLATRLDAWSRRGSGGSTMATVLMGLTFTVTSFTCTAPFVGTLLVTASQGDWQWPLLGMLAFSSVFALPFFVLALMPHLLTRLPRSGEWMTSVKVSMAFLEVAAAVKFLSNVDLVWKWSVLSRDVVLGIWIALGIGLAAYLLLTARRLGPRGGWGWRAAAAATVALTVFLSTGLFGRRLGELEAFLPPASGAGQGSAAGVMDGELPWILNDYEAALARASREGRLVLIDFTGYTCTNCRWMEANMFPRPEVRDALERYVRVRLYTDGDGPLYEKHQQFQAERFKTVALPYYAVMTADGTTLATFAGLTRKPEQFLAFLTAIP